MAYAVIELLTLNFALTPPFRQTLVSVAQLKINKKKNYKQKEKKININN